MSETQVCPMLRLGAVTFALALLFGGFAGSGSAQAQQRSPSANSSEGGSNQRPGGQQEVRAGLDPGYVGYSLLHIPGVSGDWNGTDRVGWIRAEAHYWRVPTPGNRYGNLFSREIAFPIPGAPRDGRGDLILSVRKESPVLAALMKMCRDHTKIGEIGYSVSAERSNRIGLRVPRPEGVPEHFEFKLLGVRFSDCPVVREAPEQAIVVSFEDIEWLNWKEDARSVPVKLEAAELMPLPKNLTGETRSWVLTWFALGNHVSDDQCPVMNLKPTEKDYYALVTPAEAARERAALAGEGGVGYENGLMALRGPSRLNAVLLPGIVPDPGQVEPKTTIARGLNLDGDDGTRRKHKNYVSANGAITGIDNQLFTVMGCTAGWQGRKGFMFQYNMENMRNGALSILLEINGIDDSKNDDEVYVTMLYSHDDMAKSGSGAEILPYFTFRASADPKYSQYFQRVRGRIKDGVVLTDPVDEFQLNVDRLTSPRVPGAGLADARMRIELKPDGSIDGLLSGYADWRQIPTQQAVAIAEFSQGFQMPALYNSLKRNADGLKDPLTGEFQGISAAYEMEGVPAFVVYPIKDPARAADAGY
jgi:hypothetical protein